MSDVIAQSPAPASLFGEDSTPVDKPKRERKNSAAKEAALAENLPPNLGKPLKVTTPDFSDPNRPKTCLEVDFPLVPINALSALEGNAGKPIYQMSKWWARRRSCVFRALLLAAAMEAPTQKDANGKRRLGRERVTEFVAKKAPRYRPILNRIPEEQLVVDTNISDKELDLLLHKHLAEIENKLLSDGHDVMMPKDNESYDDYKARLNDYLKTAEDIKKSDLANYVAHRRVILDLLEKAIQKKTNGKYEREDLIHNLIMPMGTTSDDVSFDSCNLWLIDERLAFHDYLASDKTLSSMPITGSEATKEPDIVALNAYDNPILVTDSQRLPLASIVVVELKRPMRNDAASGEEKDPVEQALSYVERIRDGKVQTQSGRPIPKSEDTPGFCYVICDITPTVEKRCKLLGLRPTHDFGGYFGYNPNYRAYLEVISFDRLVNAAKERNKAFFDKLGLPTS